MNILLVHNFYHIKGGEDTVFLNEKELLKKNGNNVYEYTKNNEDIYKYGFIYKIFVGLCSPFNIKTYFDIIKIIKKNRIDIVHVHNYIFKISPSVFFAAHSCNIPVIQTIHNFRYICLNGIMYRDNKKCDLCLKSNIINGLKKGCYRNSFLESLLLLCINRLMEKFGQLKKNYFIVLTELNKEILLSSKKFNEKNLYVKPNVIINDRKNGDLIRKNRIVFASRIEKEKGIYFILDLWKKYGEKLPSLLIAGSGPDEEDCREYISKNGIDNVEMIGYLDKNSILKILSTSKALVNPSFLFEGFPMAVLESFSCGTPVICPNNGNFKNLVIDGQNGYKYNMYSLESCYEAIKKINKNKNIYKKTYNIYSSNYSEESNYNQLIKIYNDAICREKSK